MFRDKITLEEIKKADVKHLLFYYANFSKPISTGEIPRPLSARI